MHTSSSARAAPALIHTVGALALVLTTGVACAAGPDNTSASMSANDKPAASAGQKIMLDPDTGNITDVPSQRAEEQGRASAKADKTSGSAAQQSEQAGSGYTAWTTRDGTQMVATDSSVASAETVVRCPDGSLRMGHASRSDTDDHDQNGKPDEDSASLCQTK